MARSQGAPPEMLVREASVALGAFLARRGEISVVPLAVLCWLANTTSAAGIWRTAAPTRNLE